eukprot:TRINITY_DN91342_c0_g1_i1.p1 TRINITY_DN91342_c0_g1~~TRINITY_DN91342_c0_g1_i1.p1  ORF type:complete len:283 (+),score=16.79 TRINITY_DN91342_c0_g1_i1:106-954(+)
MAAGGMADWPEDCGPSCVCRVVSERTVSAREVLQEVKGLIASNDIGTALKLLDSMIECSAVDKPLLQKRQWIDLRWSVETQMSLSSALRGVPTSAPSCATRSYDDFDSFDIRSTVDTNEDHEAAQVPEARSPKKRGFPQKRVPSQLNVAAAGTERLSRPRNIVGLVRSFRSKSTGVARRLFGVSPDDRGTEDGEKTWLTVGSDSDYMKDTVRSIKPTKPMVHALGNQEMGNIFLDRKRTIRRNGPSGQQEGTLRSGSHGRKLDASYLDRSTSSACSGPRSWS